MFGTAAFIALMFAGIGGLLDFVSEKGSTSLGGRLASTVVASALTFGLILGTNVWYIWSSTPTYAGTGWPQMVIANSVLTLIVFGLIGWLTKRISAAPIAALVAIVFMLVGILGLYNNWTPGNNRTTMGHELHVTKEKGKNGNPLAEYPPTLDSAMVTVSESNAMNKASQVLNTVIPHTDIQLGTAYKLDSCFLKPLNGHNYYFCGLRLQGTANIRSVKGIVPCYIMVDAQNANANAHPVWYPMYYTPGGVVTTTSTI
jgi:hypothetical protein